MNIACPSCATTYEVAPAAIGAGGRPVRCVRCRSVWFVEPERAPAEPEPADAAAVAAPPDSSGPAAPRAAEGMDLDGLAAWGLNEPPGPNEPPAAAPLGAEVGTADRGALAIDPLLGDMMQAIPPADVPPLVPMEGWPGMEGALAPVPEVQSEAPRRGGPAPSRFRRSVRPPSMPTMILVLAAILAAILGWRADVVRLMPQTASLFAAVGLPVNLRGLAFEDVQAAKEVQDGVPVLVVEGRIVNVSRLMLEVPRIRFALRNAAGNEVYNWTTLPARPILAPNAEQAFRTRLASPPGEGRQIVVRFFSRRDVVGGLR